MTPHQGNLAAYKGEPVTPERVMNTLKIAADHVCSSTCPSKWETGKRPPHSAECQQIRGLISDLYDEASYADLRASGGHWGAP
jgi:hypothetical protein